MKTMPDRGSFNEEVDWRVRRGIRRQVLWAVLGVATLAGVMVAVVVEGRSTASRASPPPAPPVPTTAAPVPQAGYNPLRTPTPDWDLVVRQLADADNYLHLHPDPARVGDVYDRENPAYAEGVQVTASLAAGDLRYDPLPQPWPIKATHFLSKTGGTARVTVEYSGRPVYRVVDRAGRVVVDNPAAGPMLTVWTLKYSDGQWRILSTERV